MKVKASVYPVSNEKLPNLLARASITLDESFVVKGLSVMKGSKGDFVSMPQQKIKVDGKDKYEDRAFPLSKALRDEIDDAVLSAYREKINMQAQENTTEQAEYEPEL